MKKVREIVIILLLPFIYMSCNMEEQSYSNERLDLALSLSGANRYELEKVIRHYSQFKRDSLSLKAALFLIENMPGHYTLESQYLRLHRQQMDSLYPHISKIEKIIFYTLPIYHNENLSVCDSIEDVNTIKADFLIKHIDNKMKMWKECSWLKNISFQDFCEYLLPYRMSYEPLIKDDFTIQYWERINVAINQFGYDVYWLDELKAFQRNVIGNIDYTCLSGLGLIGMSTPIEIAACLDISIWETLMSRACGIPTSIDYVPCWAIRNGRHYWFQIIDRKKPYYTYDIDLTPRTGKVYRKTYSSHATPLENNSDSVPTFFLDPFQIDVTSEYIKTSNVLVSTTEVQCDNPNYVYLSVFNENRWKPIAWSKNVDNQAQFLNMGRNIIYLPTYYHKNDEKHFSNPFYLSDNGSMYVLEPDTIQTQDLFLHRKYPLTLDKIQWALDLAGAVIEASNIHDFSKSDTLAIINSPNHFLNWMHISIKSQKKYRYWRISRSKELFALAEMEFYDERGKEIHGLFYDFQGRVNNIVNDKNKLSYDIVMGWLGIDFGSPISIQDIYCLSRTDDNAINKGDVYELLYYNQGWISLQKQFAEEDCLIFHNVPSNALYWLRDLNTGKEERIFTYQNDKIKYW